MKSLEEHNKEAYERYEQPPGDIFTRGAGVLCPRCGIEMGYTDEALVVLACWPPKRRVHCVACGHDDYKVEG